jgi:hypothetical protein
MAYKIKQTTPLFAINGALVSRELIMDGSDTTNIPKLSLSLDTHQLTGSNCVESKEMAIGGAKWALIVSPVMTTMKHVCLKCTKLPKGARSVETTYTITPENSPSHTKEYSFSLDGLSDGFPVAFQAATKRLVFDVTIQIKVSFIRNTAQAPADTLIFHFCQ